MRYESNKQVVEALQNLQIDQELPIELSDHEIKTSVVKSAVGYVLYLERVAGFYEPCFSSSELYETEQELAEVIGSLPGNFPFDSRNYSATRL